MDTMHSNAITDPTIVQAALNDIYSQVPERRFNLKVGQILKWEYDSRILLFKIDKIFCLLEKVYCSGRHNDISGGFISTICTYDAKYLLTNLCWEDYLEDLI